MLKFLILTLGIAIGGCASRGEVRVNDLDRPLAELQQIVVKSMPLGLRDTSANGREYRSNYFVAQGRKFKPADKLPERSYAHVIVLGDRRPYTIQIFVRVERGKEGSYSETGTDKRLAKAVYSRIRQQLNKRREELNIIDDFRVF